MYIVHFILRYEMIRVNESLFLPQGNERGLFSYLWNQVDWLTHKFEII
jgi:hypothetical protein